MPCSRQVTIRLWMMPTCLAPSSVQQKSHDLSAHGNDSQGALEMVGIDRNIRIGEEHLKAEPTFARIGQALMNG